MGEEHELSSGAPTLKGSVRITGAFEGEGAADDDPELAPDRQVEHVGEVRAQLLPREERQEREPTDALILEDESEELGYSQLEGLDVERAVDDETTEGRERRETARRDQSPGGLEDDVRSDSRRQLACSEDPFRSGVVDGGVRSERVREVELRVVAHRSDDQPGARTLRDLDQQREPTPPAAALTRTVLLRTGT